MTFLRNLSKKTIAVIIAVMVVLSSIVSAMVVVSANTIEAWDGTAATSFAGGTGAENDPYIIENAKDSDAIKVQLANPNMDIFTGLPFKDNTTSLTDEVKEEYFREYVKGLTMEEKAIMYVAIMSIPSMPP